MLLCFFPSEVVFGSTFTAKLWSHRGLLQETCANQFGIETKIEQNFFWPRRLLLWKVLRARIVCWVMQYMYYCLNVFEKLPSAQQPVWACVCVIKKASDRATRCYTVHTNHRRTFGGSLSELSSQCTEYSRTSTKEHPMFVKLWYRAHL